MQEYEIESIQLDEGWRIVHEFAPGTCGYGAAESFEIILEREDA